MQAADRAADRADDERSAGQARPDVARFTRIDVARATAGTGFQILLALSIALLVFSWVGLADHVLDATHVHDHDHVLLGVSVSLLTVIVIAVALLQYRRQLRVIESLRESEMRYRSFVAQTANIVWVADARGRTREDSPSFRSHTGQTLDEYLGDGWQQPILPEDRPRVVAAWQRAVHEREVFSVEHRLRDAVGVYRPFLARATPVFDEQGTLREWLGVAEDISARKAAEAMQQLFAAIVAHSSDAIVSRDRDAVITSWNAAAERLYGYRADEVVGSTRSEIQGAAWPVFLEQHRRVMRGETLPLQLGTRRHKNGSPIEVRYSIFPVRDETGEAVGTATVIRDVSGERRVAETQALLAAIVEHANDAVISRRLDGTITSWNAAATRLLGYTAEEALGRHASFISPGDLKAHFDANTARLLNGEPVPTIEAPRRRKDGVIVPVSRSLSPILDGDGRIVGIAAVLRDLSALKRAEADLRLAARIYEHAAEGLAITDADHRIVWINRAYAEITGFDPTQATGQRPEIIIAPGQPPGFHEALWAAVQTHGRWHGEVVGQRRDGSPFCMLLSISAVYDGDGAVSEYCWIFMDITSRKRSEQALQDLNAALEDRVAERTRKLELAVQELSAFSYSVSHDLRTPIRAILGYSELLMTHDRGSLAPEAAKRLERIHENAQWMGRLIDDLLRLARVSQLPIVRQSCDLTALAREVVHRLQAAEPGRAVAVTVAPGLHAHADPGLVARVLENLIGNAWKFTAHAPQPRIEVGVDATHGAATYFVRDNGVGFDMQFAHKLFTAFQRLHHRDEFEGTGIGLTIVHRIVAKHGGEVRVDAAPGKGATFFFTLG